MAKIGVISDTHDLLRPQVTEILQGCDAILHAGDFTNEALLDELGRISSVYAVLGNNDWALRNRLKKNLRFEIEGFRFVMAHERWNVPTDLKDVDMVIFGHSHKYFQEVVDGRLWLNPGGCGRRRFAQELTMALLYLENGKYYVEKIELNQ